MNDKKNKKNWFLRGIWAIISLVGVSGVIAIMTYMNDVNEAEEQKYRDSQEQAHQRQLDTQQQYTTRVSGAIYKRQTNESLGNVDVGYGTANYTWLDKTDPNGRFSFELPYTTGDDIFPIRLILTSSNWHGMVFQTDVNLSKGEKKEDLNIYINSQLLESWNRR